MKTRRTMAVGPRCGSFVMALALLAGSAWAHEGSAAVETKDEGTCDPGLAGEYNLTDSDDTLGMLENSQVKKFKIKKDSGKPDKPGKGFKKSWRDASWKNTGDAEDCLIQGTVDYDGCAHKATIQQVGTAENGKPKIEVKLTAHGDPDSVACKKHVAASEHSHGGEGHLGSAHGTGN